jgi:hypothetical protein
VSGSRLFPVALAIALVIVALWWQLAERRARLAETQLAAARVRIVALSDSVAAGGHHGAPRFPAAPDVVSLDEASPGGRRVLEDLARHPELIPIKGTEGGTMRFYPSQSILMPPAWVYAYFEDGHNAGHGLFEYRESAGGRIEWKLIAARKD